MPHGGTEREVKLGADPALALPDLTDLVEHTVRLPEQHLLAVYFDTSDLRLWARNITLRLRVGEGATDGIWTLKLPRSVAGPLLERRELEWPGDLATIPDEVRRILLGVVRRAPLRAITCLETARQRVELRSRKQRPLAEVDDDLVTIHGGPHDGERFRQIEVELNGARDELLTQCVHRLRQAGAWPDDRGPKLARAVDGATRDGTIRPRPKSALSEVVRASLQAGLARILDNEYLLRLEDDISSDAIHQTRVATRRLRSDLKTFRSVLDPIWVRHTRRDLKWFGDVLGQVRDADVLGANLGLSGLPKMGDTKGVTGLRRELRGQRDAGVRATAEVMMSERYLLLLDTVHAASERPPFLIQGSGGGRNGKHPSRQRAAAELPKLLKRPWKKLRREVRRAGSQPTDRQLHQIRISAKQLRYAAEASEPVVGKRAARTAHAAEQLQTTLGSHHDAVVAEEWLRRRARGASWQVAFSAGRLANDQVDRQRHARRDWTDQWEKVDRRSRAWLT